MVVGLKIYLIKNIKTYETLKKILNGYAFFRKDETEFYMKCPENKITQQFCELDLIVKLDNNVNT